MPYFLFQYFRKYQSAVIEAQSKTLEKKKKEETNPPAETSNASGEPNKNPKDQSGKNQPQEKNKNVTQPSAPIEKQKAEAKTETMPPTLNKDGTLKYIY